jgi:hypothetical protein
MHPCVIAMINDNYKSFDTSETFETIQLFENRL